MTAARIIERVQFGYAKSGQKLGLPHTLYRPSGVLTPALAPQNIMRTLPFIASATPDASFARPQKRKDAEGYALVDVRGVGPAAVRLGDYLDGPSGTWFFATLDADSIPTVIGCNEVVTVSRPGGIDLPHEDDYGGRTAATDVVLVRSWPASALMGGSTQAGRVGLPGDVPDKGFTVLLPATPGVVIRTSDRITDNLGRALTVAGAEMTSQGWRIEATMSAT